MTDEERFWKRVHPEPNTGCWLWGANQSCGYGRVWARGKPVAWAHRQAWEYTHGPIPEGLRVIHRCGMRVCVNPAHLFLGTKKDVQDNTFRKGRDRRACGVEQRGARLDDAKVREIRRRWEVGESTAELARAYGVAPGTVYGVTRGLTWKHVPAE